MFFGDFMLTFIPVIVFIGFIVVFGIILVAVISSVKQSVKNKNSPLLTVPAKVVTKRVHVYGDNSSTNYYVTFEVQSGDRMELKVDGKEYGMLVEEDLGLLSFRGTKFLSFERHSE